MGIEGQTLAYTPEQNESNAGIEVFERYGAINVLETLSGGDVLKWETVKGLSYEVVYVKLCLNRDKAEYEKKYRELTTPVSTQK